MMAGHNRNSEESVGPQEIFQVNFTEIEGTNVRLVTGDLEDSHFYGFVRPFFELEPDHNDPIEPGEEYELEAIEVENTGGEQAEGNATLDFNEDLLDGVEDEEKYSFDLDEDASETKEIEATWETDNEQDGGTYEIADYSFENVEGETGTIELEVEEDETVDPVAIEEGGDTAQQVAWGTNGTAGIIPAGPFPGIEHPDPEEEFADEMCIGERCDQIEDQPPTETIGAGTELVNRSQDLMSGTLTTSNIEVQEELCIGTECSPEHAENPQRGEADDIFEVGDQMDGPLFVNNIHAEEGAIIFE